MTTRRAVYTVVCLSGHGIGPEVMAQASRAVAHVSRLHGFTVTETHPPFGAEAFTQSGHALPAATQRATLGTDAVLVAAAHEPALAFVESELDLHSRIDRVVYGARGEITFVSPLGHGRPEETLAHAFGLARESRASVASVGGDADWRRAVRAAAEREDGVSLEELPVAGATQGLAFEPERFDVVVTLEPFAEPLVGITASGRRPRVVATGHLARGGPGVFAPTHGAAEEIAGQGVANPASMLLAAALMLGEGLGERRAAETLTGALLDASGNGTLTPDVLETGVGATTRQFADIVLAQLPFAWTNAEFYREAVA
jgi:3-isopropylmalate dehydrogenase